MPQENLSHHIVKGVRKLFEEKAQRLEKKELQKARRLRRALEKPHAGDAPDWDPEDPLLEWEDTPRTRAASPSAREQRQPGAETATVVEVRGADALVSLDGRVLRADPSPKLLSNPGARGPLAVGDRVRLALRGAGHVRIEDVLPRRSALSRGAGDGTRLGPLSEAHVLAANIDQVIVVASASEPPFRPRLIDRYLVAASRDGLPAVVCVNKADLGVSDETAMYLDGYRALGVPVLLTSAATGEGMDGLQALIGGKTSLFTGHSGVGKSSLLNALEPGLALRVGSVTQTGVRRGKGAHTTTSARLVPLSQADTFVVDSPGIRAFGLAGLAPAELCAHFPDLARLATGCEFRDCLHDGEQGCAVPDGVEGSEFLGARLESYLVLLAELR